MVPIFVTFLVACFVVWWLCLLFGKPLLVVYIHKKDEQMVPNGGSLGCALLSMEVLAYLDGLYSQLLKAKREILHILHIPS